MSPVLLAVSVCAGAGVALKRRRKKKNKGKKQNQGHAPVVHPLAVLLMLFLGRLPSAAGSELEKAARERARAILSMLGR